jgi:DNA polymerase III gamma/tau subunit
MTQVKESQKKVPDILRFRPGRWDLFIGNARLKRHFRKLIRRLREEYRITGQIPDINRLCFLITGESRSGKTALVRLFVRCLSCQQLDEETLDPCDGTCSTCRQQAETHGLEGLFSTIAIDQNKLPVHFSVVDCTKIHSPDQLRDHLIRVNDWQEGLRVCYFDEIHRLVHRGMDEMLLKEVEEKNFLWLFSTAKPQQLEDMFLNRLIKLKTQLPCAHEMELWLAGRCIEWGINWESEAVMRVVEKSNRIVGTALHALAIAAIDPTEGLTLDLVENDWTVKLEV